ncbi:MAG: peptidase M14 [Candidatus Koribacter versatilis]|uniref:Peptidase M14 n=1 Tax=Candidatus Korobacter versatilis TaxID=658062 RepID=A0A932EQN1_9BACT|nr:peptidase M14 [Candidatus Koribacter versatilis]
MRPIVLALVFSCAALAQTSSTKPTRKPAAKAAPVAAAAADWTTPAERSDYRTTPRYDETMAYVQRVAAAAPKQVKLESFGKTPEGRDLWVAIVSKDGTFDPAAVRKSGRAVLLVQNAIHAGEMDGKDSSLALLRDMVITRSQAKLLESVVVLIVPIYNADGHERFSAYNRINQNGPEQMGWRTQAQNLNLNRDYLKADAPETRALLRLFQRWLPDFFIDDHVTDGADYQYDTTYAIDIGPDVAPATADWLEHDLKPYIEKSVSDSGHVIGEYVGVGEANPKEGISVGQDTPRFSTGYMVAQSRPGLLVEMHMLKDYKTRVTGNYEILRAILEVLNRDAAKLVAMNQEADETTIARGKQAQTAVYIRKPDDFPLRLAATGDATMFPFLGYKRTTTLSEVSGGLWNQYGHEPENVDIPLHAKLKMTLGVGVPGAYIVPAQWTRVIDVLRAHAVEMRATTAAWSGEVETYRCKAKWAERPFEGHHVLGGGSEFAPTPPPDCTAVREKLDFPAGSMVVPMDQRAAKVAMHWLEPQAPDSAVYWGYFDAIFEQKEYGEAYVVEKLAREMMAKDPKLKAEFEQKVASDKEFAGNSYGRLNWWFQHSPWWDARQGRYPVGRVRNLEGIPVGAK